MSEVLYPTGYGTTMVTLDALMSRHHPDKIHPEFARRLRAWLEAQGGRVGIGGSWRATQPAKPGFAPEGKSFHQSQTFASGRVAFCAVDLVHVNPGKVHRSPTWGEVPQKNTDQSARWGLHCNVKGEPWHIQPNEVDGWAGWASGGRKDFGPVDIPEPAEALVFEYPGTPVKLGSQGVAVKLVQAMVGATVDGDFGPATERRVKEYQTKNGLTADGVVGRITWGRMFP